MRDRFQQQRLEKIEIEAAISAAKSHQPDRDDRIQSVRGASGALGGYHDGADSNSYVDLERDSKQILESDVFKSDKVSGNEDASSHVALSNVNSV